MTLRESIRARLEAESTPEARASYERVVPGAKIIGVKVPVLRALAREIALNFDDAANYLDACVADRIREEMLVGIFSLGRSKKNVRTLEWPRVKRWTEAIDNWEVCDQLGAVVVAELVHSKPALEKELHALTKSKNMWQRRFALSTASAMNQKGRSHPELTEALCVALEKDTEPMVRKAVAWARREAAKALH